MASKITIINQALAKLGDRPILALTENNPRSKLAAQTYDQIRDSLLEEHIWKFAQKRVDLAASATAPVNEFARAFPLPSDYLHITEIIDVKRDDVWRKDGNTIATDLSAPLSIRYTRRVESVDEMTPLFRDCLIAKLAYEWAWPISRQQTVEEAKLREYETKLGLAKISGAFEESNREIKSTTWLDARW